MLTVEPTGAVLGATIRGVDASKPLTDRQFGEILVALGRYGVLRFPDQKLEPQDIRIFSERFGEIQGASSKPLADSGREDPQVGILSNIKQNGEYIGSADAGQDWHTDMSYRDIMGFVNVLYGITIPRRNGKALGGTEFSNMHAAYDALPQDIKTKLADATATHNFEKFWEHMRRDKNSGRPPMSEEQKRRRPPVTHPVFLTHPLTGKKVLYCNIGYATHINGFSQKESDELLGFLFDHQLKPEFRWTNVWTENDLLLWDNLGTIHQAIADYRPEEPRLMRRCQVLATKVFDPSFQKLLAA